MSEKTYEQYLLEKDKLIDEIALLTDDNRKTVSKRMELSKKIDELFSELSEKEKKKSKSFLYFKEKNKNKEEK